MEGKGGANGGRSGGNQRQDTVTGSDSKGGEGGTGGTNNTGESGAKIEQNVKQVEE